MRLGALVAGGSPDIVTREVAADPGIAARPLRIGARMLGMHGERDLWPVVHGAHLPPYGSQVHTITDALVCSASGIVALASGALLEDTLDHTDAARDGYVREAGGRVLLGPPRSRLSGRHLSLLLGNYENHFHFLLMNLARIALLDPAERESLDSVLVPADLAPSQHDAIRRAGLPKDARLRPVRRGECLTVETLVLPWNVASGHGVNPVCIPWLRALVPPAAGQCARPWRRIYVDRGGAALRRLINEAEIIAMLGEDRVEPVRMEGLSLAAQARLMQEAELVVGPHGAGLTNMVFASPETRVVEIMPSGVMNWCYRHLAAACGHAYDWVIGMSMPDRGKAPLWADWTASPTHVLSAVEAALDMWI